MEKPVTEFSISPLVDAHGVKIVGELDVATAPRLTGVLDDMATQPELVLDLTEVTFIDSWGLRSILTVAGGRNGAGPIVIRPSQTVARLFDLLALGDHPGIDVQTPDVA